MCIPRINAKTDSANFSAAADVRQMLTTSTDINEPYDIACKLEQKRVECAIMINCALAE